MLKAVFFDIDDTWYSTSDFASRARNNSVKAMIKAGLRLTHKVVLKELEEVISEFTSNYEQHYDKLLLRFPGKSYAKINPALIVAAGVIAYHQTKISGIKPFPNVIPILKKLKKEKLIIGIISNGLEIKQAEKIIRLGIQDYLTSGSIFLSDQIGISKPNPKIYQKACDQFEILPKDVIYVSDNMPQDIDPANKLGISTVLVRCGKQKYATVKGKTNPDYTIKNFKELLVILRNQFKVKC